MCNKREVIGKLAIFISICLVFLTYETGMTAENVKLPEWVEGTISLPVPDKIDKDHVSADIYYKENTYVIMYGCFINNKLELKGMELDSRLQISQDLIDILNYPKKRVSAGWQSVDKYKIPFSPSLLRNTPYTVEVKSQFSVNCDSPLNYRLKFIKDEKPVGEYMLVFSSQRRIFFRTRPVCWGMNNKDTIYISNRAGLPLLWDLDNGRLLLGNSELPYFLIINSREIDQALKETMSLVFDQGGVKGYWIKSSLVEQWIIEAEKQFKRKKRSISLNEYVDDLVTKKLRENQ